MGTPGSGGTGHFRPSSKESVHSSLTTQVLISPGFDGDQFIDVDILVAEEPIGANVLALGDQVLVSSHAPKTAQQLYRLGLNVAVVDVSEFHKADGALTCLSVRLPQFNSWCA